LITEKTLGGSDFEGAFTKILKLNDTVFYIASGTNSSDGDITYNPWPNFGNYWLLQINNKGDILWNRVCGGSNNEQPRDAVVTNDGGVLALGITESEDGDITDFHGFTDLWLIKLDGSGQKQWTLSLGGRGLEEGGSVIQTTDGGYMVVGATTGDGGGNFDTTVNFHGPWHSFIDVWVVKLDSAGNIQWQQCYGGTYDDFGANVLELSDGYVILGSTMSNDGDVSGLHSPPGPNGPHGGDIWVFKIDKTGKLLWQKCLGGAYWDSARNIFTTSDGGVMIVGSTASNDGDVSGNNNFGTGYGIHDVWFAKIDSLGNLLWQYCYGGRDDEMMYRGVIQKSDWDYVLAIGTTTYNWRCYSDGNPWPDVRIAELYDSTVGVKETHPETGTLVRVYPNPAKETINVKFTNKDLLMNSLISIFDINGKLLLTVKPKSLTTTIKTDKLKSGLYFMKIRSKYGIVTKKIIIR